MTKPGPLVWQLRIDADVEAPEMELRACTMIWQNIHWLELPCSTFLPLWYVPSTCAALEHKAAVQAVILVDTYTVYVGSCIHQRLYG